ncbi:putative porin [Hymenobacter sp. NST-14]|uniref:putative porin n=1 Tax=Hymenobacter piscis TaxID=2839984 RepID=UPI001C024052|nr:putative porin [Hymenobacter piscis]MBT9395387.1 putative porin [Hymenobacter piscis]
MSDSLLISLFEALRGWLAAAGHPVRGLATAVSVLLLAVLLPGRAQAQILDDSTQNRYGARTTFILQERDLLREDTVGRMIDTTLTRLPQSRYWTYDTTFQQDLGNFGTASRPLLWEPNRQLGARLGRNVFDKYARDAADVKYYDTRSPYTFFRFHQGNPYEQIFEFSYARSLKKRFNAGFDYERFGSNKAVAVTNTKTGLAEHSNFLFFVRYQSLNDRYRAMANFSTARHTVAEQGPIVPQPAQLDTLPDGTIYPDLSLLFNYQRETVSLTQARNRDSRDRVRLLHSYRLLGRGLTAFHIFDWSRQLNKYTDTELLLPSGERNPFYPELRLSTAATDDRAEFRQWENTVGLMGNSKTVEYRLYARQRYYSLATRVAFGEPAVLQDSLGDRSGSQLFLGGTAAFRYRQYAIETAGEIKPDLQDPTQTEYWLRGRAVLDFLSAELLLTSVSPTLTEQQFEGNHYAWNKSFSNTQVQQLRVRAARQLGRHYLEAVGTGANIANYIYYSIDPNSQTDRVHMARSGPFQQGETFRLVTLMGRYRLNVGHLFFDNQATYTYGAGADNPALRIPKLVGESRLYYQGSVFRNALFGQVGVQGYFQSRWKAYDYSPSTQQFFVQDHFTIRNTPVVDVFLSADIKTVSIFFKMAYVNQFLPQNGYFATPYYAALPRRLQFGLRWQFFN